MNRCPNYLVCGGEENKYSGVCFDCDMSLYGYFRKRMELAHGMIPSVDHQHGDDYYRKLEKEEIDELIILMEKREMETGVLDITEKAGDCPVCLMRKNIFVKHPTCGNHEICNDCFKITFLNGKIEHQEPKEPKGYSIFCNWEDRNGISFYSSERGDIGNNYSYWVNDPKPEWPEHIKQIYPDVARYYRKWEEYDRKIEEAKNLRGCLICRKVSLKI